MPHKEVDGELVIEGDRLLIAKKMVENGNIGIVFRDYRSWLDRHDLGDLSTSRFRSALGWLVYTGLAKRSIWMVTNFEEGKRFDAVAVHSTDRIDIYTRVMWEYTPTRAMCHHSQLRSHALCLLPPEEKVSLLRVVTRQK